MKQAVIGLAGIGLAGCAASGAGFAVDAPSESVSGACQADPVQAYLGRRADATRRSDPQRQRRAHPALGAAGRSLDDGLPAGSGER